MKLFVSVILLPVLLFCISCNRDVIEQIDISDQEWRLWLDKEASWRNDSLFLPPVDISSLPVNEPTGGWNILNEFCDTIVRLPATVEEYLWGNNGGTRGITGNYTGVSWFSTVIDVPSGWKGKKISIDFESVRMRAEVFVNRELAGYDIVNGTPFSFDVTSFIKAGEENEIAVRITDPNGNFAWRDWDAFLWGDKLVPPSHGFGGITGKVILKATDYSYISDIYIKNLPDPGSVDAVFTLINEREKDCGGKIVYEIRPFKSSIVVASGSIEIPPFSGEYPENTRVTVTDAMAWSPDEPNLYVIEADWLGNEGDRHSFSRRFGFRWFEVKEIDGDKMFFLNGKRIVLRSAISWGHWPVNGIYPTKELERKQIETAKALGLNMLNFHRSVGQEVVLDLADELGLLYYEEPGGYKPNQTELLQRWKREKLLRMVHRDRSHPSLVIYNMINESNREPFSNEIEDMKAAHDADETRIITFTSTFFGKVFHDGSCPLTPAEFKSHMLPYQDTVLQYGWWDEHHAGGPGVYMDSFYRGPDSIFRHYPIKEEILALGEEGAIGTLPRLQLMKREIETTGSKGWDGDDYLKQYDAISRYLKDYGFSSAFPDVDALTQSIGAVSHYFQGRIIENFRIGNTGDFYVINGWEDTKLENHSGIVDVYRNPKADPSILAWYNQPLYLAVKIRDKVIPSTGETGADIFIVNENDISGDYTLDVSISDNEGIISSQSFETRVTGGVKYGELLAAGITVKGRKDGYLTVNASLRRNETAVAEGHDDAYLVNITVDPELDAVAVVDTSGVIREMLQSTGISFTSYDRAKPVSQRVMIAGRDIQPGFVRGSFRQDDPVIDWVSEGNTLVIISGADKWCEYLEDKEVLEYRGRRTIDINWFGGNYFIREHPLFEGLPVNMAFNWEYQSLASYNRERFGLRIPDVESIVGVYAEHMQEVYTAVAIVPVGRGRIIISTLDLEGAMAAGENSAAAARRLLINYIRFGAVSAD